MDPTTQVASSEVINYHQTIGEGNMGSDNSKNFTSVTINENGLIEVKYGNNIERNAGSFRPVKNDS